MQVIIIIYFQWPETPSQLYATTHMMQPQQEDQKPWALSVSNVADLSLCLFHWGSVYITLAITQPATKLA